MDPTKEHHQILRKSLKSAMETLEMIRQAFGEESMGRIHGCLSGILGSGQTEKCETRERERSKSMLIIFFHKEFVLAGQTAPYCCDFYGDYVRMCDDFTLNVCDWRTGCCITTTHHLTLPFPPGNFWPKTT
jgi:hypothetical protein